MIAHTAVHILRVPNYKALHTAVVSYDMNEKFMANTADPKLN